MNNRLYNNKLYCNNINKVINNKLRNSSTFTILKIKELFNENNKNENKITAAKRFFFQNESIKYE
jgi:hypothetical protein